MENHENEIKNNGFMLGFLLGLAAAMLLTTKIGRKILRKLLDQGWDKLGNWEEIVKTTLEEDDSLLDGDDYTPVEPIIPQNRAPMQQEEVHHAHVVHHEEPHVVEAPVESRAEVHEVPVVTHVPEEPVKVQETPPEQEPVARVKSAARRFFRGVPKRG